MQRPIGSFRRRVRTRLERPGLSPAGERRLNIASILLVALFAAGWVAAIVQTASARTPGAPLLPLTRGLTATPLSERAAPPAAFLLGAAEKALAGAATYRGYSRAVDVIFATPGETAVTVPGTLPANVTLSLGGARDTLPAAQVPSTPGVWNVVLRLGDVARAVPGMSVISMVPFSAKRGGRIGSYLLGSWPYEGGGKPRSPAYLPPRGFVQVTPENQDVHLTAHIRLRDYLTKGQSNVWPKYIAVSPRELDKVELTLQEVAREGIPVGLGVISAFRNPNYNSTGGNTEGRAQLSRHMYGDAMDIYIDADHNGCMDDINRDGRVDVNDARTLARAAEKVERAHPDLVGGIGVYAPTGAHCGFVHIDTRGYRARWGPWK